MRRLVALILFTTLLVCGHSAIHVAAAPSTVLGGPLPLSMFPGGSNQILAKNVGKLGFTCRWALQCPSATPDFHSGTADDLGRTGGWIQIAEWEATIGVSKGKKPHTVTVIEGFAFAVSSFVDGPTPFVAHSDYLSTPTGYAGMTAAQAAFNDFNDTQQMTTDGAMQPVTPAPSYVANGESALFDQEQRPYTLLSGAFYSGDTDVEAIAMCQHCTLSQTNDLRKRFAAALTELGSRVSQ